jgi:anti-sigma B factor antagonist
MPEPAYRYLKCQPDQGVLVLTLLETEFQDEKVAQALLDEMHQAVDYHVARKVVIDFQNVKYISSVAFRPLLSIRRKMQEMRGRLLLCGLSRVIGDVFYTTRLIDNTGGFAAPFEMEPDAVAAVERLNRETADR